jgi:hypothetical protein
MKVMLFNKAYKARVYLNGHPCKLCMYYATNCAHIPTDVCVLYGGFQNTNEEIFKI